MTEEQVKKVHELIEAIASEPTRNDDQTNEERCVLCARIGEYRPHENGRGMYFHLEHRANCPVLIAQQLKKELA